MRQGFKLFKHDWPEEIERQVDEWLSSFGTARVLIESQRLTFDNFNLHLSVFYAVIAEDDNELRTTIQNQEQPGDSGE